MSRNHWLGCWAAGPDHHDCAVVRIKELEREDQRHDVIRSKARNDGYNAGYAMAIRMAALAWRGNLDRFNICKVCGSMPCTSCAPTPPTAAG